MQLSFSGVLDVYRFVLAASRVETEERENLEIAEQVYVAANDHFDQIAGHFSQFKSLLNAIEVRPRDFAATHILRFDRLLILEKFKKAVDSDPGFSLFDRSNVEVESRFRLAEIDPHLGPSLINTAIEHSAVSLWHFVLDLSPEPPVGDVVSIFLNINDMKTFGECFPLFKVGDLIQIRLEG
jgi:hypothetical protein